MLDDARRRRDFPSLEGMTYLNTTAGEEKGTHLCNASREK